MSIVFKLPFNLVKMKKQSYIFLHALNCFSKFGPSRLNKLWAYFSTPRQAFEADLQEFKKAGIEEKTAQEFITFRQKIDPENEFKKIEREDIKIATFRDEEYPQLLWEIHDPPPILYYKGNLKISQNPGVAVVGSRKCTGYSKQVAEHILSPFLRAHPEIAIISGLALGVDTLAHASALENKTPTVAILGSGIAEKNIFPSQNQGLARKIIEAGGAVTSEFPPNYPAFKYNFPQRNRIISGLARAVLVVEAQKRSGAWITAQYGLEQDREVVAVPGNIFSPASQGTNKLIRCGAHPVTSKQDLEEILNLTPESNSSTNNNTPSEPTDPTEKQIFQCLNHSPVHINYIAQESGLDITTINSKLSLMEIKGAVKNVGGMKFVKNSF